MRFPIQRAKTRSYSSCMLYYTGEPLLLFGPRRRHSLL